MPVIMQQYLGSSTSRCLVMPHEAGSVSISSHAHGQPSILTPSRDALRSRFAPSVQCWSQLYGLKTRQSAFAMIYLFFTLQRDTAILLLFLHHCRAPICFCVGCAGTSCSAAIAARILLCRSSFCAPCYIICRVLLSSCRTRCMGSLRRQTPATLLARQYWQEPAVVPEPRQNSVSQAYGS